MKNSRSICGSGNKAAAPLQETALPDAARIFTF